MSGVSGALAVGPRTVSAKVTPRPMASPIGSSSAWGMFMYPGTTGRTMPVFVPSEIFQDNSLPPLRIGDVISLVPVFITERDPRAPGAFTAPVTVRPRWGHAPQPHPYNDATLLWHFEVLGDGWTAYWSHDRPVSGRIHLTGRLIPDFVRAVAGHPGVMTGKIRRLQLVEEQFRATDAGPRPITGTAQLRDLGPSPDRYWPNWRRIYTNDDPVQETGVLVDLDLDAVPDDVTDFEAGAVTVTGTDVWVMDRANPLLLHVDTSHSPPQVVEYLLPLSIEPPPDKWSRRVHADRDGCWITSPEEIVRCARLGPTELSVHRVTTEGGDYTIDYEGRLFVCTYPHHSVHDHPQYGFVHIDPDQYPVRELIDGDLIPVLDDSITAIVQSHRRRADRVETADGTKWIADATLTAELPEGTVHTIDLDPRTPGQVQWIREDPSQDPAFMDLPPESAPHPRENPQAGRILRARRR